MGIFSKIKHHVKNITKSAKQKAQEERERIEKETEKSNKQVDRKKRASHKINPPIKKEKMAEEKRGIEETKDILDFMFSFVDAVGKAKKDGEMSWSDARYFIDPVKKLFEAVDDIEEVLPEIEDLSGEEYDELVELINMKK